MRKALDAGEDAILLIVAESSGSSPGRQGFKMAVAGDELCGSIGGGVMEVNLVNRARETLDIVSSLRVSKGANSFFTYQIHQKNSPSASGMICSGKQTVIFKLLTGKDSETIIAIINSLENRNADLLTITASSITIAPSNSDALDFRFEAGTDFFYRERLGHKNELYIVGGGHCALALSELMSRMDFYIRIYDDRPELNTIEKNTFAHEKHVIDSYEQIADRIPGGRNVYVVVMTLGFTSDETVIRRLLGKDLKYFGVLGSNAKMATLLRNLKNEGYSEDKLKSIRTPIGLPINSQTPDEIAISIAAEIISVKNAA